MSVCTNLVLDRSSHLAAYAGYVVLRAHLRAHKCALAIADPPIFIALSQWVFGDGVLLLLFFFFFYYFFYNIVSRLSVS
jgi:hypothetical protein